MGENLDPKLAVSIKKTQELLGKYVKKPPLTEKNLARPPFRFLHDVVTAVNASTGLFNGLLSSDEMDSSKVSTKEAKNAFIQKVINAIKEATGELVSAKISKILAGQEPEKTNELLQALARAIEKSGGGGDGAKATLAKKAVASKAKGSEPTNTSKDKNPRKNEPGPGTKKPAPGAAKKVATSSLSKAKPDDKVKKTKRDPSPAAKNVVDESEALGSRSGGKVQVPTPILDTKGSLPNELDTELPVHEIETIQIDNEIPSTSAGINDSRGRSLENKTQKSSVGNRGSALKRQNSSLRGSAAAVEEPFNEGLESLSVLANGQQQSDSRGSMEEIEFDDSGEHVTMNDDFLSSYEQPDMGTVTVPTSPIISDSSGMQMGFVPESSMIMDISGDNLTLDNSDTFGRSGNFSGPGTTGGAKGDGNRIETQGGFGDQYQLADNKPSTPQIRNRAGTGTSRISSSRPPSARPAPPRPKSSIYKEAEESNYRPTTGKVSNVLLDSPDTQDEDETFVIRETEVSKGLGLADLDETPELALTSDANGKFDELTNDFLPPEQRGLLVNQILETQKELEDKENDKKDTMKSDFPADRTKSREVTQAEIEKLKTLIQGCARMANPLGKFLDYVREDMDAMQKELSKWRDESRQLDLDLESARQATEASLQPLKQQLKDVEIRIQDKEDAIGSTKMTILKHQERIEKILSGLDRVQSSHGKIVIPKASQLMQQKIEPSSFIIDPILASDRRMSSSTFGSALNRLSKSSAGGRPIVTQSEDLDPDNFNPWKE